VEREGEEDDGLERESSEQKGSREGAKLKKRF
jgi:hypothetical protein